MISPALRIACLEPSATAICLELGLADYIVGVTHECGPILDRYYSLNGGSDHDGTDDATPRHLVLTRNGLTVTSQIDIHLAIQKTAAAAAAAATCPTKKNLNSSIPSLYPLIEERMEYIRPTVIFTQDLCDVCAPNTAAVRRCLLKNRNRNDDPSFDHDKELETIVSVIALQPETLHEVTDTVS
mmetsp:Transcript_28101/g.31582  ORF Transcript_28101/g.31582 Transcript_28101/m.31582 type:complete len:184 (-) Transcript_28101:1898-2449(-)